MSLFETKLSSPDSRRDAQSGGVGCGRSGDVRGSGRAEPHHGHGTPAGTFSGKDKDMALGCLWSASPMMSVWDYFGLLQGILN